MSAPGPRILQVGAALLAGAFAASAALIAFAAGGPGRRDFRGCLAALARANERWAPEAVLARMDGWLRKAGRPRDWSAGHLIAAMQAGAALFLGPGIAISFCLGLGVAAGVASFAAGAAYPLLWLRDRVRARHQAISRALPYDLDLLTLSVEAGLDFAAALAQVVEKGRPGPLADELALVLKELRLGKTREQALRNLAQRVDLPALTSFVQALVHADRMGTPLGKVLRILSTQLRVERTQRAEKLANEAPVKLLLPLVLFIFPTLFLMLFGPLLHQFVFEGGF